MAAKQATVTDSAKKFKTKKVLTRPTISLKSEGAECYVKIVSAMHVGREMKSDEKDDAGKKREPATILEVINLETGEEAQVIAAAMIRSTLEEEYPGESYVGKCFYIANRGKQESKAGNRFNRLYVEEIEEPSEE
jgi:hypothetical protein